MRRHLFNTVRLMVAGALVLAAMLASARVPGQTSDPDWSKQLDARSSVGISWFLEERDGRLVVSHGGGDDGFISAFVLIPSRKFAFVMMTNSDSAGIPLLKQIQAEALSLAK